MADYKKLVTKNMKLMYPHIPQQDMKTIVDCIFKLVAATDNAALAEPVKKIEPNLPFEGPMTHAQHRRKDKNDKFYAIKKQEAADKKKETEDAAVP